MAIGSMQSASSQKLDFMNLLVTQLQNQNPLEPMDNQDMSAQLAQFTQLEQLENLNMSFDQVLEYSQRGLANDMIGKQVSFVDMESYNEDGTAGVVRTGQVIKMEMQGDIEMLTIAEVDQETFEIKEYDIRAEKVTTAELDEFAQFKEFDQLVNLNQNLDHLLRDSQRSFANSTIGKKVSFVDTDADGESVERTGQVVKMDMYGGTEILKIVRVDPDSGEMVEHTINASKVTSIMNPFDG